MGSFSFGIKSSQGNDVINSFNCFYIVRVSNGVNATMASGTLEVYLPLQGWTGMCSTSTSDQNAVVACKQLGFLTGERSSVPVPHLSSSNQVSFQCTAMEEKLSQCENQVGGSTRCLAASVTCCEYATRDAMLWY